MVLFQNIRELPDASLETIDERWTLVIDFPFDDVTRIEDFETAREVVSDPQAFQKAYLEEFAKFLDVIRAGCSGAQIDFVTARTDEPFDRFLGNYLMRRQALSR